MRTRAPGTATRTVRGESAIHALGVSTTSLLASTGGSEQVADICVVDGECVRVPLVDPWSFEDQTELVTAAGDVEAPKVRLAEIDPSLEMLIRRFELLPGRPRFGLSECP